MYRKVMFISSVGGHLTQMLQLGVFSNNYKYVLVTETKLLNLNQNIILNFIIRVVNTLFLPFKFTLNIIKSLYLFPNIVSR